MEIKNIPQFPELVQVSIEHKNLLQDSFLKLHPEISELNFTEIFMWADIKKMRLGRLRGNLCIFAEKEDFFYPPIGYNQFIETIKDILDWQKNNGKIPRIYGITDKILNRQPELAAEFLLEDDRDCADYVYLIKDLIELNGRKYGGKRNLIRQFKKDYRFEYINITKKIIPDCLEFQKKWCETHACIQNYPLHEENLAALELLNNLSHLDAFGAVIKINGTVEAFTVGSELNPDTAVIHLEKGNPTVKGIYQAINQMFCENRLQNYTYVNREQDMGSEGLRRAKMSYHPQHMVDKHILKMRI